MINALHVHFAGKLALLTAAMLIAMASVASAQKAYKTAEEAANAFISAVRIGDRKSLLAILGQDGADIISSGDDVADTVARQQFVAAYDSKHQITMEGDNRAIIIVGQKDFPFPIPIARKNGLWLLDTAAGRSELLYRRIGRNELDTIQTCLAYVDAQNDYADKDRTGAGKGTYAQRIVSSPGKNDGLYWPASQGNDASPLGEFIAKATGQGYRVGGRRTPYHGYYYKVLTQQGPDAPGGALNYIVHGKMIGGFALIAYPVQYRYSGVMTFLVNHTGVVFQKDLGERTTRLAERMTWFNPDETWKKVDVPAPLQ